MDLYSLYAHILKITWMCGFYCTLIPITLIIGMIAIFLAYWMDKYLMLRRYARPSLLSNLLNQEMIELMEYFPMAIASGSIFFSLAFDSKTR